MQRGVQLFLQWAMMQGVAMLLQNRYQRQRLYTRIALGKVVKFGVTSLATKMFFNCMIPTINLFTNLLPLFHVSLLLYPFILLY